VLDQDAGLWVGPDDGPDTYRLVSLLGRGGEGAVWRAELPLSAAGRGRVAIKIQPDAGTLGSGAEWTRYGRLLAAVHHPGLVRVREVFVGPDRHPRATTVRTGPDGRGPAGERSRYVVMDFVEGRPLPQWIEENPGAGIGRRLRLLGTVADALDELHSGRQTAVPVAHGDVKPGNMIVTGEDSTVLVDLGGTRLADGPGEWLLTSAYAAPELYGPDSTGSTPEADRFAFVASVVHVLVDEPPPLDAEGHFDLAAVAALLSSHPRTANEPGLRTELLSALQAEPARRPAPLTAFLARLDAAASRRTASVVIPRQAPAPAAPPRPHGTRRRLLLRTAVPALVVLATVAGLALLQRTGDRPDGAGALAAASPPSTTPSATAPPTAGTSRVDLVREAATTPPPPTAPPSRTSASPSARTASGTPTQRSRTPAATTPPASPSTTRAARTSAPTPSASTAAATVTVTARPPSTTTRTTTRSTPPTRTGTVNSCNTYGQNCNAKNIYVSVPPDGYNYTTFPRITTVPNGATLTARCWAEGGRTYNWAAKIAKPDPGPNPYDSTIYYSVQVPGSSQWGYLPDTYFVRDKSGRMGLPAC
jgi:serine/threonine protein kinase